MNAIRLPQGRQTEKTAPFAVALNDISFAIVRHLRAIAPLEGCTQTADHAIEQLLKAEAEEFALLNGADDIYSSAMLGFGVEFGIRAAAAVIGKKPQAARSAVARLFAELKAEMNERIEAAGDIVVTTPTIPLESHRPEPARPQMVTASPVPIGA